MPFNVLLLPLLGGYVFITRWNRTRYATSRHSGERLLFHAALAGAFFLSFGYLVTRLLIRLAPAIGLWWRGLVPFPYSGSALVAFTAALFAPAFLNRMRRFESDEEAKRAIRRSGDLLEEVLLRAVRRAMPVAVILKAGKVYVGFVTGTVNPPVGRQHIGLLPLHEGSQNGPDHRLVLNIHYTTAYERIIQRSSVSDSTSDEDMKDLIIVLPVSEVQSVNIFDDETYRTLTETSQPPADAVDSAA